MYTYEEYLKCWQELFGNQEEGNYPYWQRGQLIPYTVKKLTPEEFSNHLTALTTLKGESEAAKGDVRVITDVLARRLPHELALLI